MSATPSLEACWPSTAPHAFALSGGDGIITTSTSTLAVGRQNIYVHKYCMLPWKEQTHEKTFLETFINKSHQSVIAFQELICVAGYFFGPFTKPIYVHLPSFSDLCRLPVSVETVFPPIVCLISSQENNSIGCFSKFPKNNIMLSSRCPAVKGIIVSQ